MSNSSSPAIARPLSVPTTSVRRARLPRELPIAPARVVLYSARAPRQPTVRATTTGQAAGRRSLPAFAATGVGRRRGQLIDAVVPAVARMALDPADTAGLVGGRRQLYERLPQVAVGHRFVLGVLPVAPQPALPPAVGEALDDIGGVADDVDGARPVRRQRTQRLERRGDLHALVGGVAVGARGVGPARHRPGPAPGSRIAPAGTVRVHDHRTVLGLPDNCVTPATVGRGTPFTAGTVERCCLTGSATRSLTRTRGRRRSGSTRSMPSSTRAAAPAPATSS